MSNHSTDPVQLLGAYGYMVQGFAYGVPNLLVGLSVLKYSALHQLNQYVLLMSLAFADAANMFSFSVAGAYRLWAVTTHQLAHPLTPIQCLTKPHSILWLVTYPFAAFMLVILSVDRLFMVSFPSVYILSLPSPKYAVSFVLSVLSFVCLMALLAVLGASDMPAVPSQHAFCFIPRSAAHSDALYDLVVYYYDRISFLAFLSVVVFAAVPVVHKLRTSDLNSNEQESQNHMTKTIAVSSLCTLCLFCIPDRLGYVAWDAGYPLLGRLMWLLSMTNPAANIIIYSLRHFEVKQALRGLLTGKQMPETLGLWPKQGQNHQVSVGGQAFQMSAVHRHEQQNVDPMELQNL